MKLLCNTRGYVSHQSLTPTYGKLNKQHENLTAGPLLLKNNLINPAK